MFGSIRSPDSLEDGKGWKRTNQVNKVNLRENATFYRETSLNEFVNKTVTSPEGDETMLNMRVRSWLRMNAGGVPNTCKSSEKLITEASVEVKSGKRRTGE